MSNHTVAATGQVFHFCCEATLQHGMTGMLSLTCAWPNRRFVLFDHFFGNYSARVVTVQIASRFVQSKAKNVSLLV